MESNFKEIEKGIEYALKRSSQCFSFFCALCSQPRKISMKPTPYQPIYFFRVGVATAFFTLVFWNFFGWKGIAVLFPFWVIFEWIYRTKLRQQMECPHCGFDPYLYQANRELANAKVKAHFAKVRR